METSKEYEVSLPIAGMTCASCASHVEGALRNVEGVSAITLSQETFKKIKQNLFWAFFYNVAMIPLAVIGWMHPVLAEIAMATSSITVVSNANRLRKVDIRPDYKKDSPAEDSQEAAPRPAALKA